MVSDSVAGESRLAEPEFDTDHDFDDEGDQPRVRKRRVKVRRKQDKFPHSLRIAILVGAPTVLWLGIFLLGRAIF